MADLTERLETRKAVDRAKAVLQEQLGLSEPEAFRWIQKTAMDLRLSMRQVADGVITHGPTLTLRPRSGRGRREQVTNWQRAPPGIGAGDHLGDNLSYPAARKPPASVDE